MAKRIGLSGGIGSGKSTVAALFGEYGIPIFDADKVARDLTTPQTPCGKKIIALFGEGIVNQQNQIDRQLLGDKVFADKTLLRKLEAILHPAIREKLYSLADQAAAPYAILEIQLLIENRLYEHMYKSIIVHTDEAIRRQRLITSRNLTEQKINRILQQQASDEQRFKHADYIIYNNDDLTTLKQQVNDIHTQLLKDILPDDIS